MLEVFLIGGLVGGIGYLIVLNPKIGFGGFIAVCILGIAIGYFEDSGSSNSPVTGNNSTSSKAVTPEYGCLKNDCINGEGVYAYSDGSFYRGNYKDGKEYGEGSYYATNGHSYVGGWKDGNKHGQGTYDWPSGDLYKGGWKDNKKHGEASVIYKDGTIYNGTWVDDVREGKGITHYPDGSKSASFYDEGVDICSKRSAIWKIRKCPSY